MIQVLFAAENESETVPIRTVLDRDKRFKTRWVASSKKVKEMVHQTTFNVVIAGPDLADTSGIEFLRSFVPEHPFINCSLMSSLNSKEFHEETEGLGLFLHLPATPTIEDGIVLRNKIIEMSHLPQQYGE